MLPTGSKPVVREVLTLQVGHYSNCVATHWWNLQDSSFCYDPKEAQKTPKEIESDFLFREGRTLSEEVTYTPRTLCFDLKDSLRTLRPHGSLYNSFQVETPVSWPGDVTLHQTSPHPKNEFLADLEREEMQLLHGHSIPRDASTSAETKSDADSLSLSMGSSNISPPLESSHRKKLYDLDDTVDVWSDFLRPHLHPKTVSILPQYTHDDENDNLDLFCLGANILKAHPSFEDDTEDRIRFFVEDCDSLQGFQVLVDAWDGIGGFGTQLVEMLADEHASKCTIAFPMSPGNFKLDSLPSRVHRVANTTSAFHALATHCNVVVPLNCGSSFYANDRLKQLPYLNLKPIYYHTSAVLASALDSLTSPYRRYNNPLAMSEVADVLAVSGRVFASTSLALPFRISDSASFADTLLSLGDNVPWHSVSSFVDHRATLSGVKRGSSGNRKRRGSSLGPVASQLINVSGVPVDLIKGNVSPYPYQSLSQCNTAEDVLKVYASTRHPNALSKLNVLHNPLKLESPFPHIFNHQVGSDGLLLRDGTNRSSHIAVESVPVTTCVQNRDSTGTALNALADMAAKIDLQRFHKILQLGVEREDFEESISKLRHFATAYNALDPDHYDSDSDD